MTQIAALDLLAIYRERREHLHDDVRAALDAGATHAEVARVSGLTRQWVSRIAHTNPNGPTED